MLPLIPIISTVSNLSGKLGRLIVNGHDFLKGVDDEIRFLHRELLAIECFLKDVDSKHMQTEGLKNWLRELRKAAVEAEHIIDFFFDEVCTYSLVNPKRLIRHISVRSEIKKINTRIKTIVGHKSSYAIAGIADNKEEDHGLHAWRSSYYRLDDNGPVIFGFDNHTEEILDRLFAEEEERIVIPIVGMGGIGKSTLARTVFNQILQETHSSNSALPDGASTSSAPVPPKRFDFSFWASVTQCGRADEVLRSIMNEAGTVVLEEQLNRKKYEGLAKEVYEYLKDKKYLIVLDDVWTTELWDLIEAALPRKNNGSRVILTTRRLDVGRHASPGSHPYELETLTDEQSCKLFFSRAFSQEHPDVTSICLKELKELGDKLSSKCGGCPLALVVLAGLASRKGKNPVAWLNLLNSINWEHTDTGKRCLDVLTLSYHDLPYHIKPCFLYVGSFPAGSVILVSKLIEWWIADGLIIAQQGETMEQTAQGYLDELVQRCLVQVVKEFNKSEKEIRVNDLLHKLARSEARESQFFHFRTTTSLSSSQDSRSGLDPEVHRLAIHNPAENRDSEFCLEAATNLRVLLFTNSEGLTCNSINGVRYLRVLELEGTNPSGVLTHIHEMIHLRYLGLRNTGLEQLPASIAKLRYLQVLDIRGTQINGFGKEFSQLSNLRHLYLNPLQPEGIGCFRDLQTLDQAIAGEWITKDLRQLISLTRLTLLDASQFENTILCEALQMLSNLTSLELIGRCFPFKNFIAAVAKHDCLHELKISARNCDRNIPEHTPFPRYLTKLTLVNSGLKSDSMAVLEKLLSLRILVLALDAYVDEHMVSSAEGFPQLQHFGFINHIILQSWTINKGAMPNLNHLAIHGCQALRDIPAGLQHVTTLKELNLKMSQDFLNRIDKSVLHSQCKVIETVSDI